MIDQYFIIMVSYVEWDIFIRLFSICVVVLVLGFYCLVIVYQGSKVFFQIVNCFVNVKIKLFKYIIVLIICVLYVVIIFYLIIGNMFVVVQKIQ